MDWFRRIVVGIDLTPGGAALTAGSRLALDQARSLAADLGSQIVLVHSIAPDEQWVDEAQGYVNVHRSQEEPRTALETARAELADEGIDVTLETSSETAWLAIARRVIELDADLVIVGKRTHEQNDGRRIGSVCHKLLRHCPTTVWAVKPGSRQVPKTILGATDLGEVGDRVVELSTSLAIRWSAHLHVVDALQLPLSIQMEGMEAERAWVAKRREEARAEIVSHYDDPAVEPLVTVHIGLESPSNAILEAARLFDPDLTVMGTVARAGLAGLVVGNTAERLIGRLDCSLLTVKPVDFELRLDN